MLKKIGTLPTLSAFGKTYNNLSVVHSGVYHDGTPRVSVITESGKSWAILTVSIGADLEEGEILVKTWSENESLADALRSSDMFEDTGKRLPTGFVMAEIWKVKSDA